MPTVDIHGYDNLESSKTLHEKLFWAAVVSVSVVISVWWISASITQFLQNPTAIDMKSKTGCIDTSEIGSISSRMCQVNCAAQAYYTACSCIRPGYVTIQLIAENSITLPVCTPYQNNRCMYEDGAPVLIEAYENCTLQICGTPPCDEWIYSISTSYLDLNARTLQRNVDAKPDAKLGLLYVYFADLSHVKYTEFQTITYNSIVSSIGGTLGLFLGASLISGVQLIVKLVQTCFSLLQRSRRTFNCSKDMLKI